jgi:hypothetical protein
MKRKCIYNSGRGGDLILNKVYDIRHMFDEEGDDLHNPNSGWQD